MQRNIRFRRAARAVDAMRRAKELKLAHCDECALGFQRAWRSREARRRLATMVRRRYLSARLLRRKAWRRWAEVAHVLGKVAFVSAAIMRRVVAMREAREFLDAYVNASCAAVKAQGAARRFVARRRVKRARAAAAAKDAPVHLGLQAAERACPLGLNSG